MSGAEAGRGGRMKSGLVAVAGRPNVGKSTLVNALTGEKIAITSTVPNTTRRRIFGVANGDDWQLVLVDLPGFQRPMDALTERMQETVDGSFEDVDVVLFVLSARDRIGAGDRFVARRVFSLGVPVVIALNKIDRLKHGHVASQMKQARRRSATSMRYTPSARRSATASTSFAPTSSTCSPRGRPCSLESRRPT